MGKKLTIKQITKFVNGSSIIWQDEKNENIFYGVDKRNFTLRKTRGRPPKHPWNRPSDTTERVDG